ncbi:hypothetical protein [Cyclonatronum proteinivorum]|uniref:hypothetical protein n=1 Tax=Cyclonatronum proteinivorum TaxID=1457365 RepID=UPI000E0E2E6B|nr:hypothetical protein [Cyclonatronum proteinivorum]
MPVTRRTRPASSSRKQTFTEIRGTHPKPKSVLITHDSRNRFTDRSQFTARTTVQLQFGADATPHFNSKKAGQSPTRYSAAKSYDLVILPDA